MASPVPNLPRDKDSVFSKRWTSITNDLGVEVESSIRYQPIAALSEKLFVLSEQNEAPLLVQDYNNLLVKLVDYNRNGIDFLLTQAREAIRTVDIERMERLFKIFQEEFPNRSESLMIQAEIKLALNDLQDAVALAYEAVKIDPIYREPFDWLVAQLARLKRLDDIHKLASSGRTVAEQRQFSERAAKQVKNPV